MIRPDISYLTKELSRDLTAPTIESATKAKSLTDLHAWYQRSLSTPVSKGDNVGLGLCFGHWLMGKLAEMMLFEWQAGWSVPLSSNHQLR